MKVLHVINSLGIGGAEMGLVRLTGAMDRRRFETTVVALRRVDALVPRLRADGIRTELLDMRGIATIVPEMRKLIALVKEVRPDVVNTSMYHANLFGLFAAQRAGTAPVCWSIHASALDFSTYSIGLKLAFKLGAHLASIPDTTVFNSRTALRWHLSMGFNFRRWQFVPNGVDTAMFHPDPNGSARLKTALGLMPNDLIVGSVGRFHPQKDYPTLLRALAMVMRTDPRVHAVIVGSSLDSANRALTKLATLLRIRERIHLLGPRSDTQSILAGFDLFVLASAFGEACPTVLVEAMACGVPCVATDIGDSAQIIGDTGKIVAARDPSALAAACSEMLADRSASSREAARQRVLEGYSLERMTKGYADVFESLINKRSEAADGSGSHVSCSAKPRTDRGGSASPDDQIDSHS